MTRYCSHRVAFKRQVAGEFIAGEPPHALAEIAQKVRLDKWLEMAPFVW